MREIDTGWISREDIPGGIEQLPGGIEQEFGGIACEGARDINDGLVGGVRDGWGGNS